MSTARRIAYLRLIGALFSIVGLALAFSFYRDAVHHRAAFEQWLVDEPMRTSIDLSSAGEVTMPFRQTCAAAHAQVIELSVEPHEDAPVPIDLVGLRMTITIGTPDGAEVASLDVSGENIPPAPSPLPIARFHPFATGDYVASILVISPAPALAGHAQTLVARYELCGLELMPAAVLQVAAIGAGIVSAVIGLCILPGLIRHGVHRKD